jgi:hypothetical protein
VRIYGQDGRPVDNLEWWDECYEAGMYPGGAHGNVFPRPTTDWDEDGECYEAAIRSPFGAALPGAEAAEPTAESTVTPTTEPDFGPDGEPAD